MNNKLLYCVDKYRKIVRSRAYDLLMLFHAFFRIGSMSFGSGLTMIPILQAELVEKRHWVKVEDLLNYYALCQGLPGIMMVNISCFVGYQRGKKLGSIVAALGVVTPSIIIITGLAKLFTNYSTNPYITHALNAVSACVCALIFSATVTMFRRVIKDIFSFIVFAVVLSLTLLYKPSPVIIIPVSLVVGIVYCKVYRMIEGKWKQKLSQEIDSNDNFDLDFSSRS
ncbi:MAG: chromate transporter [Synergistaceae bacterium]|nr:chromate transporter [Synergistaceae bacterium]